jgi:hypothetical protein
MEKEIISERFLTFLEMEFSGMIPTFGSTIEQ